MLVDHNNSNIELTNILQKEAQNKTWVIVVVTIELVTIPRELTLNWENTEYKWVMLDELKNYDLIPEMEEYLSLLK